MQPYCLPYDNPIPNKKTSAVAWYLFSEILLKFGFPRILHSHNGTELKSKLIEHLAQQLGIKKTYISPTTPSNIKLESSKDCIWKFSIDGILEWEQSLPYVMAAFTGFQRSILRNLPISYFLDVTPTYHTLPCSYNKN